MKKIIKSIDRKIEIKGDEMANNGGFSWKTFLGLTAEKRKLSRKLGIPLTKTGRNASLGAWIIKILFGK